MPVGDIVDKPPGYGVGAVVDTPPGMQTAAPGPGVGSVVDTPPGMQPPPGQRPPPAQPPVGPLQWRGQSGVYFASPVDEQDFTQRVTPEMRSAVGLFTPKYRLDVTSVEHGHHVAGSAHYEGRATDVGLIDGSQPGRNPATMTFLREALLSGRFEQIGTTAEVANDPQLQQMAHSTGTRLFVDEGSGPHVHLQVAPKGQAATGSAFPAPKMDPIRSVWHAVLTAGTDVARGADAVLGAPQRFVAGALLDKPGEFRGWEAATHPFDSGMQEKLQQDTAQLPVVKQISGAAGAVGHTIGALTDLIAHKIGHNTHNADFLQKVSSVIAAQAVTDPLTALPVIGALSKLNGVRRVLDASTEAARAVGVSAGARIPGLAQAARAVGKVHDTVMEDGVKQVFGKRPELNPYLDGNGKAARISIEEKHITRMEAQAERDRQLLKRLQPELRDMKQDADGRWILPEDLHLRYLGEAYAHGTPAMRGEVLRQTGMTAQQFERTVIERGLFEPHDILREAPGHFDYDVMEDYQTLIHPNASAQERVLFDTVGGEGKKAFTPFELERLGERELGPDQYAITENRLMLGRNAARFRAVDEETGEYLRQYGGWKGQGDPNVGALSQSPIRYINRPGMFLGQLGKAGITINPFPHGLKNVGELTYLAGGPEAFGKGLAYATKGLGAAQRQRLADMGVAVDYLRHTEGTLAKTMQAISGPQQHLMNRLEMGYRQARLDQLDRELGPSIDEAGNVTNLPLEYRKAEIIRDDLGDYRNVSRFVAALQSIGGPFVAFRLGIVPKAVSKAIAARPDRPEFLYRTQTDINEEMHRAGAGATYNFGDPSEDLGRLAFKGPDYMTSESTVGPLGEPIHLALGKEGPHQALQSFLAEYAPGLRTISPWAGMIPGMPPWAASFPYHQNPNVSMLAEALASLIGSYFGFPTSAKRHREIEKQSQR